MVPEKCVHYKGWYTYNVHEHCPIFNTPHPLVHLSPIFFHSLDLGRPISNKLPPLLQIITNQLKENIIQGWLFILSGPSFRSAFVFSINSLFLSGFPFYLFSICFVFVISFLSLTICMWANEIKTKTKPSHVTFDSIVQFSPQICNSIIKGWLHCLTSVFKIRFLVNNQ